MIGSLGIYEILFILVLALLIFGPRKLPEIGRTLGRALGEFKRSTQDLKRSFDAEISVDEGRMPRNPVAKPAPAPHPPRYDVEEMPKTAPAAAELEAAELKAAEGSATEPASDVMEPLPTPAAEPDAKRTAGSDAPSPDGPE